MWSEVSFVASLAAKNRYDWRYAGLRSVLSVREDVIRGGEGELAIGVYFSGLHT